MGVGADRTSNMGRFVNDSLSRSILLIPRLVKHLYIYMGTQSRIGQTSAITKTTIEIARLLAQAHEDLSAFDVSLIPSFSAKSEPLVSREFPIFTQF